MNPRTVDATCAQDASRAASRRSTSSCGAPSSAVTASRAMDLRRAAVTAFVDTNVLVRHLTGDPPAQAARATRYLQRAETLS